MEKTFNPCVYFLSIAKSGGEDIHSFIDSFYFISLFSLDGSMLSHIKFTLFSFPFPFPLSPSKQVTPYPFLPIFYPLSHTHHPRSYGLITRPNPQEESESESHAGAKITFPLFFFLPLPLLLFLLAPLFLLSHLPPTLYFEYFPHTHSISHHQITSFLPPRARSHPLPRSRASHALQPSCFFS